MNVSLISKNLMIVMGSDSAHHSVLISSLEGWRSSSVAKYLSRVLTYGNGGGSGGGGNKNHWENDIHTVLLALLLCTRK